MAHQDGPNGALQPIFGILFAMLNLLVVYSTAIFPVCDFSFDHRMEGRPNQYGPVNQDITIAQSFTQFRKELGHIRIAQGFANEPIFDAVDFHHVDHGVTLIVFFSGFHLGLKASLFFCRRDVPAWRYDQPVDGELRERSVGVKRQGFSAMLS